MRVVIMGCGRVGSQLAAQLFREGHTVSVVDTTQKSFQRLPEDFGGLLVIGTGIDEDVLRTAGIEGADAFVAVTEGDNRNIMAAQVAREIFGVPQVLVRIYDPGREAIYRELGLDTICPTTLVSSLMQQRLADRAVRSGRRA
jgi:trk system potassium uptake protein